MRDRVREKERVAINTHEGRWSRNEREIRRGITMHFGDVLRTILRNGDSPSERRIETNLHISKDTSWLRNCDEIGGILPDLRESRFIITEFKTHLLSRVSRVSLSMFRYIFIEALLSSRVNTDALRIYGKLLDETHLEIYYFFI